MKSIIGKKVGMTSIFDSTGKQTAVTIIEAGPCIVTQKKTVETDGYNALQIAFGDKKEKHSTKAEINHFSKANTAPKRFVKEIRDSEMSQNVGESITVDIFSEGDKIEVVGTTKGKGFQGVVKRHGFSDSTIVKELQVLLVTHRMRVVYLKECVWPEEWEAIELK
ncbi:MAG: 50S ribosomal protein L3 [Sphingobacteriales bacterium]|nr:50S ribosomal protein L3 [Sphingobacteriales bacterium]